MINAQQMEEMRRAFYMMDTNGDGVVCQEDLETIFENLGTIFITHHASTLC